jgi:SRSO17 transposase
LSPSPARTSAAGAQTYLRGLLLDGKRRSIQPMATRLAGGDAQADADALEQALQQFVNSPPGTASPCASAWPSA